MASRTLRLWMALTAAVCMAEQIPAGALLEIRLLETVTSYSVGPAAGEEVRGVVVAPVTAAGRMISGPGAASRAASPERQGL